MRRNQKPARFALQSKAGGYVIGVDGGGTKTVAALAGLGGKILAKAETGSAHPRNIGVKKAVENAARAIKKILPKEGKILSTFLGLPAIEEEFNPQKGLIKKELLKHKEISPIFRGKLIISSDQLVGFRSGTNKKNGVMVNSGSGCVVHGWRDGKEVKVDGWGYLSETGSAFWVGQKGLQAIWKDLDGRGEKTLITKLVFQKLKVKNKEKLIEKIYSNNSLDIVRSISILVDEAGKKEDKVAENILIEAGKELALSINTVIRKLNFPRSTPPFSEKGRGLRGRQKVRFPLVLTGSMFKSKILLEQVRKEVKRFTSGAEFIRPRVEPVSGAVKLAIEALNNGKN